jgi:bacillithiol biosynthesis cysteine-adding enzyme BshC
VARPLDPGIASALEAQNARYETSVAREAHLRALRTGSAVVCTGQQTGLFLGPLYTVYKAASTIRLAQFLATTWGTPVVPVFWLQTEDHDAAEISVCHVDRGSDQPLTLAIPVEDNGVSVAARVLPDSIAEELSKLSEALGRLPHGEEHLQCLATHYRAGAGWSQAFAGVLATLFAKEGLVLVDPRDPALAPYSASVHRKALIEARPIAGALVKRAPVHVREDAPLSFFHPDGPEGPRCRLAAADGGFVELGSHRTHTLDELLGRLATSPASFSTSALLRPILQDTWLPTVAYVGGPGELAYFAQLPPLYAAFDIGMPMIVPRAHLRLIDASTRATLSRLALSSNQACGPFEEALALAQPGASGERGGERIAAALAAGVDRLLDDLAPLVEDTGERGLKSLEKTRRTMAQSAAKLGRSVDRARLLRNRDAVDALRRVQTRLWPRGIPQERFFGLSSFAARYGQRTFVERVLAAATPFATGFEDLDL